MIRRSSRFSRTPMAASLGGDDKGKDNAGKERKKPCPAYILG
jgi:hypothetical protein